MWLLQSRLCLLLFALVMKSGEKHRVRAGDFVQEVGANGEIRWLRDRVTTGPFTSIAWEYDEDENYRGRFTFLAELPDVPGWVVRFHHELRDGVIRLEGVEAERASDDADSAPLYRKLGGRELEQQVQAELRQDLVRGQLPPDWQAATLATRRTGRRPVTDMELARLCAAYKAAWEEAPRAPMPLLAGREHRSINTLQGLLRRAVERGLFERSGQGRAGGRLTDRARQLLNEGTTSDGKR